MLKSNAWFLLSDSLDLGCYDIPRASAGLGPMAGLCYGRDSQGGALNWAPSSTSSVWFALAGTRVPSAPKWCWPDPVALKTLEKSPCLHASWSWVSQLKPPSWESSLLGTYEPSAGCWGSGRDEPGVGGVVNLWREEAVRPKPLAACSATFHSNSQPRKPALLKALVAWGTGRAWQSAAALWAFTVTTACPLRLTGTSNSQGLGDC